MDRDAHCSKEIKTRKGRIYFFLIPLTIKLPQIPYWWNTDNIFIVHVNE
jgi:hypothetical protein